MSTYNYLFITNKMCSTLFIVEAIRNTEPFGDEYQDMLDFLLTLKM